MNSEQGHNRLWPGPATRHSHYMRRMTRSEFLRKATATAALLGLGLTGRNTMAIDSMQKRVIPSTGEKLPVIGCGTWQTFDAGPGKDERGPLAEVLRVLF